ncbi:MAG: hypothetical protein VR65_24720 [Desulfobulbaceae bacterium BRH_c16a]|nr:MAG: hypothetical protein VR65_24720 [Desulfobulbaceae bacterium BRH_c16a]
MFFPILQMGKGYSVKKHIDWINKKETSASATGTYSDLLLCFGILKSGKIEKLTRIGRKRFNNVCEAG